MSAPVIAADGVRKRFGDDGVLHGTDLVVENSEILVLMGENGVGKSVLLSCLAGSERPSDGSVEVLGEPATGANGTTSLLLQDAMGIDDLTGRENIAFYARLHPRFTDRWREYTERLAIHEQLDKLVKHYSGGMTRKLELAIALSIDVPVYLFDEPTAGLDLSVIQTVHTIIREQQTEGKTFVLASHLPMDADIADRIAFLRAGEIVATGAPEELLSSLPPMVRVSGTRTAHTLTDSVIEGQLFEDNGEACGFLRAADVSAAKATIADTTESESVGESPAIETEPTYTDLFNYYSKLDRTQEVH
jgi:ABC-2 type transport system ATP-binding protein